MNDSKPKWTSQTLWAIGVSALSMLAFWVFGVEVTAEDQLVVVNQGIAIVVAGTNLVTHITAWLGRTKATKTLA